MTEAEIDSLDHWDDPDYWDFAIADEGIKYSRYIYLLIILSELQIPSYMVPPNPDDTECKCKTLLVLIPDE